MLRDPFLTVHSQPHVCFLNLWTSCHFNVTELVHGRVQVTGLLCLVSIRDHVCCLVYQLLLRGCSRNISEFRIRVTRARWFYKVILPFFYFLVTLPSKLSFLFQNFVPEAYRFCSSATCSTACHSTRARSFSPSLKTKCLSGSKLV